MRSRQRQKIRVLAREAQLASERADAAKKRLNGARGRFLGNPVNLLLPFTAGVIGGAIALGKKPATLPASTVGHLASANDSAANPSGQSSPGQSGPAVSMTSLISTSLTLWRATASLRSTVLAESAARRAGRAAARAKVHAEGSPIEEHRPPARSRGRPRQRPRDRQRDGG